MRDMLTKNGFFHVVEASSSDEAMEYLKNKKNYFVLMSSNSLTRESIELLPSQKSFLIFVEQSNSNTIQLASKFGVDKILTLPVHTRKLMNKINSTL